MQTHRGRIKLADGDEVDVDLEMTDESIRLATDATEIGTWTRAEFRIVRLGNGVFEIVIDGDRVAFEPFEVEPFEESVVVANGAGLAYHEMFEQRPDPGYVATEELEADQGDVSSVGTDPSPATDTSSLLEERFGAETAAAPDAFFPPGLDQTAPDTRLARAEHGPDVSEPDLDRPEPVPSAEAAELDEAPEGDVDMDDVRPPEDERGIEADGLFDVDGAGVIDPDDRWTAEDVFLGDPAGALGDGEEVSEWALVTPTGEFEAGWDPDAAPEIAPGEYSPLQSTSPPPAEQHAAGDSLAPDSSSDVGPHVELGITTVDDPAHAHGAVSSSSGASIPEGASEGSAPRPVGDEPRERGSTSGWNYEVLARALAELDESSVGQDASQPEGEPSPSPEPGGPGGGRFEGSSMERLSAAVNSLRTRPSTPAEEALAQAAADREDDDDAGSVADGVLASQRSLRQTTVVTRITWDLVRKVGAGVLLGIGIAAVVVLAPNAWDILTREPETSVTTIDPGESASTTLTTPVTTVATAGTTVEATTTTSTTAPAPIVTVFDVPAPQFVQAWNDSAGPIDSVLTFAALPPIGEFENEFFSHLSMLGVVGTDGTVDGFSLVVDPTGPANYDRLGIQALGVALKVVDPDSTGSSRAALLRSLGLDVEKPDLAGIDSSIDVDGISYSLRYDPDAVTLTLSVVPLGSGGE